MVYSIWTIYIYHICTINGHDYDIMVNNARVTSHNAAPRHYEASNTGIMQPIMS